MTACEIKPVGRVESRARHAEGTLLLLARTWCCTNETNVIRVPIVRARPSVTGANCGYECDTLGFWGRRPERTVGAPFRLAWKHRQVLRWVVAIRLAQREQLFSGRKAPTFLARGFRRRQRLGLLISQSGAGVDRVRVIGDACRTSPTLILDAAHPDQIGALIEYLRAVAKSREFGSISLEWTFALLSGICGQTGGPDTCKD